MRILVVGGGGREHAICWKLHKDDARAELHCAPGNPGIAAIAQCHAVAPSDFDALSALAARLRVDLVVIGPEAPLADGLTDRLRAEGHAVFGPTAAAARIESSKSWAKQLMLDHGIPTARASSHTLVSSASEAINVLGAPVVIKASGLAAGKGVFVCGSVAEAHAVARDLLEGRALGTSGSEILVEEFMPGEELSVFAFADGSNFRMLLPSQDHKRLLEGDKGPNTGGMGAYAPISFADDVLLARIGAEILQPTLDALRATNSSFTGLLYAGLMVTDGAPRVVEFNCRFGDPETQVVLPLMQSELYPFMAAASVPDGLANAPQPLFERSAGITVVMSSAGYPGSAQTGSHIHLPASSGGSVIFHAGTALDSSGRLVTSGGRVLAITHVAGDLTSAQAGALRTVESIAFDGAHWRSDIGWRELERQRGQGARAS